MLNQFRHLYPQGTICSELINIDRGLYIVKVSLQDRNLVLGTGFAAAETIEKAEDRARERALMTLNLEKTGDTAQIQQPQVNTAPSALAPKPAKDVVALQDSQQVAIPEDQEKTATQAPQEVFSYNSAVANSSLEKANSHPVAISQRRAVDTIAEPMTQPEPTEDILPPTSQETTPVEETPTDIFEQPLTPPPVEETPTDIFEQPLTSPSVEETPTDIFEQPITSPPVEETQTNIFEQPITSPPVEETPPEETIEETAEEVTETIQFDFNDIKYKTDLEMKRLGWTKEQGRDYLLGTYGKRSRLHLTDEELLEFWRYLETLPN